MLFWFCELLVLAESLVWGSNNWGRALIVSRGKEACLTYSLRINWQVMWDWEWGQGLCASPSKAEAPSSAAAESLVCHPQTQPMDQYPQTCRPSLSTVWTHESHHVYGQTVKSKCLVWDQSGCSKPGNEGGATCKFLGLLGYLGFLWTLL